MLLVIGVFGFLALCTYAAYRVPSWSATEKHKYVRCFRFLVFRFRLDSWWFGVPLLMRGPLISLPIVFATDYAGIQTVWVTVILLSFLACQALAWPWKVPGYWYASWCMMMCDGVWSSKRERLHCISISHTWALQVRAEPLINLCQSSGIPFHNRNQTRFPSLSRTAKEYPDYQGKYIRPSRPCPENSPNRSIVQLH